jgi:hypothetical protein
VLVARNCQTLVRIGLEQTQGVIAVRFGFFAAQAFSMLAMASLVFARA